MPATTSVGWWEPMTRIEYAVARTPSAPAPTAYARSRGGAMSTTQRASDVAAVRWPLGQLASGSQCGSRGAAVSTLSAWVVMLAPRQIATTAAALRGSASAIAAITTISTATAYGARLKKLTTNRAHALARGEPSDRKPSNTRWSARSAGPTTNAARYTTTRPATQAAAASRALEARVLTPPTVAEPRPLGPVSSFFQASYVPSSACACSAPSP